MRKACFKAVLISMLLAVVAAVTASSIPIRPEASAGVRASPLAQRAPFSGRLVWAWAAEIPDGGSLMLVGSSLLVLGTVLRRRVSRRG